MECRKDEGVLAKAASEAPRPDICSCENVRKIPVRVDSNGDRVLERDRCAGIGKCAYEMNGPVNGSE
jgi:hypothetical protein